MWKHFVSSLGLLAVALLSALYSSTAARDDRMVAAGISATIALVIAIWVGVRHVPRLASNVEWDWLPFFSRYKVTREGWIYFGAVTVVVFAAVNTNNNLLYMVLSALLAVLLLSGFLSSLNFRSLMIDIRMPSHCFAGESFPVSIEIHNGKTVFPSFSLTLQAVDDQSIRFRPVYITCIQPQHRSVSTVNATLHKRGVYTVSKLDVLSRYPFGFFLKAKHIPADAECICYPQILPQDHLDLMAADLLGSTQRYERGLGNDLYMIRDYLPSDSARHVHWKASAKTATLKTREFAAEESRRITLSLDRHGSPQQEADFEALLSYAASLSYHLIRSGIDVAFVSDEWRSGHGCTEKHLEAILDYLAVVQITSAGTRAPDTTEAAIVLSLQNRIPSLALQQV